MPSFLLQQLPILLLVAMLGIGMVLEWSVYGVLLWQSKLPLALLVGWLFWRRPALRK